tara:strand:+ start:1223 stop:1393 length:171 start_codon:yes stop_codon:yes gene_type:complete
MTDPRLASCEQKMNDCRHQARMCRVKGDYGKALWYDKESDYYEEMILYGNLHEPRF